MKNLLSIVLALVMTLSVVSVTAFAEEEYADFDGTITLGETRPVNLPGLTKYPEVAFFRFEPEKDGVYAIASDSRENENCDPFVELYYEIDGDCIASNEDADDETVEFYLEYEFEAGKVYYILVGDNRDAAIFDITLECIHVAYEGEKCASCGATCSHVAVDNMFGSCPCGKSFEKVITLTDGKFEAEIKCDEDTYTFYKFVPAKTGIYRATSDTSAHTSEKPDPCCDVYDSQENFLTYHDDISLVEDSENYDFDMVYEFEAGKTYFIGLWDYAAGKEWDFTFEDITTHPFETTKEETDENGNVTVVPDTVDHVLTFVPQVDATCIAEGCTGYAYCKDCADFAPIGKYEIEKTEHMFDEEGDCMTEGCTATDPVTKCDCMCHSHPNGVIGFIWKIVNFINWLRGVNQVCECSASLEEPIYHWGAPQK